MPLDQTPQTPLPDHQRDQNGAAPDDDTRPSTADLTAATDHHHAHDRLDDAPARAADDDESSLRLFQPQDS